MKNEHILFILIIFRMKRMRNFIWASLVILVFRFLIMRSKYALIVFQLVTRLSKELGLCMINLLKASRVAN